MKDELLIDFEDVKVNGICVTNSRGDTYLDVTGVDLTEILDAIGEKTIKEYYGIEEEE